MGQCVFVEPVDVDVDDVWIGIEDPDSVVRVGGSLVSEPGAFL